MNIFYLHHDPRICAQMHVDKHVIKMILETCQLLCSAHHVLGSDYKPCYKLTHKNHPSSVWCRESTGNYEWLCQLGLELCKEYTYRYQKTHKCEEYILDLSKNIPKIENTEFTRPRQAMPEIYKSKDSIDAYRAYYFFDKISMHSWSGKFQSREVPDWILEMHEMFS